jgi:hypothetical protein
MKKMRCAVVSIASLALMWSYAQADDSDPVGRPSPDAAASAGGGKGKKKDKKDFPDFKEVITDDFELVPTPVYAKGSFYKLHRNKKKDQVFAVIPKSRIGVNFMISNSISSGPGVAGWMWGDMVVRWERRDKKLLLIQPEVQNQGKQGKALSDAVRRTYTDRVLKQVAIKTMQGGSPVISLGDLFKDDLGGIGGVFGGSIDSSLSRFTDVQCFDDNIFVTIEAPMGSGGRGGRGRRGGGGGKGTLVAVNYNISSIPDTGYKPRLADDRIGYFLTVRRDWGKDYKEKSLFNRYINRWNLQKTDSSLAMSPVKKPIVFYVEKTVPVRFRNAVKEGILAWNDAYEKCGFVDAVQVIQQTETDYTHVVPEDVNYNFFRWTTVGNGLARGPSRANPLTGEIYDADIVFDDSWVRFPMETYSVFSPSALARVTGDRQLERFLELHPEFDWKPRHERLLPGLGDDVVASDQLQPDFNMLAKRYSRHMCSCGTHLQNELSMAYSIMEAQGYGEVPESFVQAIVKDVTMHEVGHTLGLRHNFKASAWLPLEDVLTDHEEDRPITGSVMDYNAFMFHADKDKQGDFCMTTLGPYDLWAIEYGYRPVGDPYKNEKEMLTAITQRVAESGLDYATDEDTGLFSPDPLINRRDMGSDPLEYSRYRIELVNGLMSNVEEWAVEDGESYSGLRKRFNRLLSEISSAAVFAGRYVGGQYFHRDHKGDPDARDPFVMVPADKQREAVKFLADHVFAADAFEFDPQVLNKLAPGRWSHWSSDEYDGWIPYDAYDQIEGVMATALMPLFNPITINRLHSMELMYENGDQPYTLAEHIRSLYGIVWAELDAGANGDYSDDEPYINGMRRGLQRAFARQMNSYLLGTPGGLATADAHALIRMNAGTLRDKIERTMKAKGLDDVSRAHLIDVHRRLEKALDAEYSLR